MKISVVVAVLNEARGLKPFLEELKSGAGGRFELIVVDGGSSDESLEIARRLAHQAFRAAERGRAAQMHEGALAASGDVLVFLHADTRLPDGWIDALRRAWSAKPRPAATAFRLAFDEPGWRYRVIEAGAALRGALTGIPQGDQAIAVDRRVYLEVGGFPNTALMEEYGLIRRLKNIGPVVLLPQKALTSARRHKRNGPFRQGLRNNWIILLFYCGAPPAYLAKLYR